MNLSNKQKAIIQLCEDAKFEGFTAGDVIVSGNKTEGYDLYIVIKSSQNFFTGTSLVDCYKVLEDGTLSYVTHEFNDTEFKFYKRIGRVSNYKYQFLIEFVRK